MLSVNRILIFVLICIFSSLLYAVDVSKFDIKGIKLGMSKSEVLKKMPCVSPDIYTEKTENNILTETLIRCFKKKNDNFFGVTLDHHNKVYSVNKRISFEVKPDFSKIKKKLFYKYKKPNLTTKKIQGYDNNLFRGYVKYFCWGGCTVKILNPKFFKGNEIETTNHVSLLVKYQDSSYITDTKNIQNNIEFYLYDPQRSNNNYNWTKQQQKLYKEQQKQKATNIDF
jgi:hypothetical protein